MQLWLKSQPRHKCCPSTGQSFPALTRPGAPMNDILNQMKTALKMNQEPGLVRKHFRGSDNSSAGSRLLPMALTSLSLCHCVGHHSVLVAATESC
jgi:hypothetical protein